MVYSSYKEYVTDIVDLVPPEVDDQFKKYLTDSLLLIAEDAWTDYLTGDRENYTLYDDELEMAWQKASHQQTQDMINKLVDLDLVQTGINKDGDIVYSITEDGKEYLKNNNSF
jgi:hypothetical protein